MLVPLKEVVIVRPAPKKEVSDGGIIIPDSIRDREQAASVRGTIVSIGQSVDYLDKEITVRDAFGETKVKLEPGDNIVFAKYGGVVYEDESGEIYRLLRDEDILAIEIKPVE